MLHRIAAAALLREAIREELVPGTGNINAATLMVGEKGAAMILDDRR